MATWMLGLHFKETWQKVIPENSVSFGVFSHSKGLGATSSSGVSWGKFRRPRKRFRGGFPQHLSPSLVCSSGTLGQIPSASKKVPWRVPPTFVSQSCLFFWDLGANSAGLKKGSLGSVEGSPNFSLNLSPSLLWLCGRFP